MRTKSCIFTVTLSIRFGSLLSKPVKSKLEAVKKHVKEERGIFLRQSSWYYFSIRFLSLYQRNNKKSKRQIISTIFKFHIYTYYTRVHMQSVSDITPKWKDI